MKVVLPLLLFLVGCTSPSASSISIVKEDVGNSADVETDFAREVEAKQRAVAKLPVMDSRRSEMIATTLATTNFPIEASTLVAALGGEDAFVWEGVMSSFRDGKIQTRAAFSVSPPDTAGGVYGIIFLYMWREPGESPSMVSAARFYYVSSSGWWFRAESVKHPLFDFEEEGANQPPQSNAGSRPSSSDSPASEKPSAPAPRG
jgi:hypothetical protein